MRISHLRVNHLREPLGYDLRSPSFSWIVSDTASARQEKARLRVFRDGGTLYDSGLVSWPDSLGTELPLGLRPRKKGRSA